ncbi:hypothetical protein [Candidatus Cryosericum odellii]|jgi:hypothetical protein|uniref:Uncharacterized protein n=1 Tax=Candidatus Cryosericum odellii TaxID=2290917 RepID=A0A398DBN6_9BACT|nr:hypothetical protein [Candidatus Cryosericum odellii]RIE08967.1 hypothetical protein SMC6_03265 [Candidatus Cryosericum odellii]RIE12525.1 hypothetical protein SMC5_03525 [Candidatus Cryosericum odellii]
MTQEELEHLLENVDWEPKVDPLWAETSRQRLVAYADRMAVHRRHVRHWRLTLGSALAILLVVLWWTQTAPLRTAIHATGQLPDSVRLLQETQKGISSSDLAESSLRQTWNNLIALVTPGARLAVVTDARRDSATGLVRATVRGTDGYILVDPHSKSLVGVVGMKVPSDTHTQAPSIPLFVRLELARQIAMADPVVQESGRQAVAVSSLTVYHLQSTNRASSSSQQVASSGTLVAVRLQQVKETDPDLTAIVNTALGRVVQIVDTTQLKGLVISDFAGAYAVVEKQGS